MNLLLLAPVWMQMVHLPFAYLLWIALVALCWRPSAGVFRREQGRPRIAAAFACPTKADRQVSS